MRLWRAYAGCAAGGVPQNENASNPEPERRSALKHLESADSARVESRRRALCVQSEMPAAVGALAPWLEREFLSQRIQHGGAFPAPPLVDPKRVQLITVCTLAPEPAMLARLTPSRISQATGTSSEDGEELVWTEVADGSLWIHCCIPKLLVDAFDRSSAGAKSFTSYSASKGLFRLLRYRFVLARPLLPPHASPRKLRDPKQQRHQHEPEQQAHLRSLRVCLRVDEFKFYASGPGSLLGNYQDFRKYPGDPTTAGADQSLSPLAQDRVEWVKRIEAAPAVGVEPRPKDEDNGSQSTVEFLQDVGSPSACRTAGRP